MSIEDRLRKLEEESIQLKCNVDISTMLQEPTIQILKERIRALEMDKITLSIEINTTRSMLMFFKHEVDDLKKNITGRKIKLNI
jgi:hypothetical protein